MLSHRSDLLCFTVSWDDDNSVKVDESEWFKEGEKSTNYFSFAEGFSHFNSFLRSHCLYLEIFSVEFLLGDEWSRFFRLCCGLWHRRGSPEHSHHLRLVGSPSPPADPHGLGHPLLKLRDKQTRKPFGTFPTDLQLRAALLFFLAVRSMSGSGLIRTPAGAHRNPAEDRGFSSPTLLESHSIISREESLRQEEIQENFTISEWERRDVKLD